MLGKTISHYKILEKLGEGGMGAEVDARTDIWSLGVVLYEMVTGHYFLVQTTCSSPDSVV